MEFFNQAIDILKILVMALGAGLAVWGVINLLEGYGSDNPAAKGAFAKSRSTCKAYWSIFYATCFGLPLCTAIPGYSDYWPL